MLGVEFIHERGGQQIQFTLESHEVLVPSLQNPRNLTRPHGHGAGLVDRDQIRGNRAAAGDETNFEIERPIPIDEQHTLARRPCHGHRAIRLLDRRRVYQLCEIVDQTISFVVQVTGYVQHVFFRGQNLFVQDRDLPRQRVHGGRRALQLPVQIILHHCELAVNPVKLLGQEGCFFANSRASGLALRVVRQILECREESTQCASQGCATVDVEYGPRFRRTAAGHFRKNRFQRRERGFQKIQTPDVSRLEPGLTIENDVTSAGQRGEFDTGSQVIDRCR